MGKWTHGYKTGSQASVLAITFPRFLLKFFIRNISELRDFGVSQEILPSWLCAFLQVPPSPHPNPDLNPCLEAGNTDLRTLGKSVVWYVKRLLTPASRTCCYINCQLSRLFLWTSLVRKLLCALSLSRLLCKLILLRTVILIRCYATSIMM